jgi:hypothetical protein
VIEYSIRVVALLLGVALSVSAADPLIGTWKLDVSKSVFSPGPAPQGQIRTYEVVPGGGLKLTLITVDVEGKSESIDLPATPDGKNYQISAPGLADTIVMTKITDLTAEAKLKHGDVIVGTSRRTVSPDGTSMTVTYSGIDRDGRQESSVAVYEKQK